MDKLNTKNVANSLAIVSGIVFIVCVVLIIVIPEATMSLFGYLFHGLDISKITNPNVSIVSGIIGLVEIVVLAWIVGWLFATIYNKMK